MRLSLSCLALLAAATTAAHATDYKFEFKGFEGELGLPYTETFSIDTTQLVSLGNPYNNAACSSGACFTAPVNGYTTFYGSGLQTGEIDEWTTIGTSALETFNLYTDAAMQDPLTLFTGSNADPLVATGTFYANLDFDGTSSSFNGTMKITDPPSASAVPEPSTLALLGSGALGLAATLRRRLA